MKSRMLVYHYLLLTVHDACVSQEAHALVEAMFDDMVPTGGLPDPHGRERP